jgi:hypothetical protein
LKKIFSSIISISIWIFVYHNIATLAELFGLVNKMEVLIHFQETKTYSFLSHPTGKEIKESFSQQEKIPCHLFYLTLDGKILSDDELISLTSSLILRVIMKLLGGKGGFGSMLKSLAKKSGGKKTTDFGACRDLSGRRLRHVNDEIILQKWKEAKDKGEEFDIEENTKTGIDLWFLNAPSWAEGFKGTGRKRYMKPRRKTRMCIDWLSARAGVDPPPGSPEWWGCPRGRRCQFAHGMMTCPMPSASHQSPNRRRRSERKGEGVS